MRVKHLVAASAASGIVALALVAPAAGAASSVVVQPGVAMPGGQISVFGLACTASTGTATSPAFTAPISLSMLSNSTGGVGTVSTNAKPGTWPVTVTCGAKTFTGSITVGSTPSGGAATGDGASQSSMTGGLATGAALAAAGAGFGALALRRRRAGARG